MDKADFALAKQSQPYIRSKPKGPGRAGGRAPKRAPLGLHNFYAPQPQPMRPVGGYGPGKPRHARAPTASAKGGCFRCNESSHYAKDCPN
jgi:hypothetical protein